MNLTNYDIAVLIGLIIGDGTMGKTGTYGCIHSIKQYDYCVYKAKLMHSVTGGKDIKVHEGITSYVYKRDGKSEKRTAQICRFSKTSKSFISIREMIYPNGKKYISDELLNYIEPITLALWWLDDGNLDCHNGGSGNICYSLRWSLYISLDEAERFVKYFKDKWDITWTIRSDSRSPDKYWVSCGKKEGNKFLDIIRPIVRKNVPSMSYKVRDI